MTATTRKDAYDPSAIEPLWRARWAADRSFEVDVDSVDGDRKFYNLVEFPYPSAEGLHVGHAYTYSGADTYGRYLTMRGREVFQPIGFDSFGIHTENYALRVGENPRSLTSRTIANYRRQLASLGAAWDTSRDIATSDPSYYRWTQWVFLKLHRAGLAVQREAAVVWCPSCLTVLANEQLEGDRCERCSTRVSQRTMLQWYLRITAYAEELLRGLDDLDWPRSAKHAQREWIGRSEGVEIDFEVPDRTLRLSVFTTRPETLPGVTFLALPPEHPDLDAVSRGAGREHEVRAFAEEALRGRGPAWARGGDRSAVRQTRGVFTGTCAVHPATGAPVPIYVADYVVATYGTGAIMGVPAHDERDRVFARAMGLPAVQVIQPPEQTQDGIVDQMGAGGIGRRVVRYRLRDWLISRQRYWGPPIPIVHCERCGAVPVPEEDLPVLLPDVTDFRPTGTALSPLATVESFVHTTCPTCGGTARRETDVSDTFFDSAWYFLRYPSSDVHDRAWDPDRTARMLPVDSYAGGPEHVVRHHLYARFVTRALHDLGLVPFAEPFPTLRLHGMLTKDGAKMSKSRGNVVNPDRYVASHGADVTRMYLLFIGPWEEGGDFSDAGLAGIERLLHRAWRLITQQHRPGPGGVDLRPLDRAVAAIGAHIEQMKFNTAISSLMDLVRWARAVKPELSEQEWTRVSRTLVLLLAPFAPHIAEELWHRIGGPYPVHRQAWPAHDPAALVEDEVTLVVQIDGRTRARIRVPAGIDREQAARRALECDAVRRHLRGGEPERIVFVPDRLINLVTSSDGRSNLQARGSGPERE